MRRFRKVLIIVLTALAPALFAACSSDNDATVPTTSTPAPTGVSVTTANNTATLTWAAMSGATAYNVYWSTTSNQPTPTDNNTTKVPLDNVTTWTQTSLSSNTIYYYVVTAVYPAGESGVSGVVQAVVPPAAPSFTEVIPGDAKVTLKWADVTGASSYNLYKSQTSPVALTVGNRIAAVKSPYADNSVVNGTTYYYVATAVSGTTGESAASSEVSAKPQAPPADAPINVSAVPTPETTKSVTISWQKPLSWNPATYRIYWDNAAGIDNNDKVIPNATSPYIQTGLLGQTTYYYRVAGDNAGTVGQLSVEVSATTKGAPRPGGGGGDTGFGNNLSFPVIFSDGIGITNLPITGTWVQALVPYDSSQIAFNTGLRPLSTEVLSVFPYFNPLDNYVLNNVVYYMQQTSSTWQAEWMVPAAGVVTEVTAKWGDNLLSKSLTANSVIRVETTLEAAVDNMVAYTMQSLFGANENEMTGTDNTTYNSAIARVFAADAHLKIEKLSPTTCILVDTGLFSGDGQGVFGAEISVGGTLAYGYNWMINSMDLTACNGAVGSWKLTFSLTAPPAKTEITAAGNGTLDAANNAISVVVDIN
jgi:fibronectin type 3 domain-containing protein